MSKKRQIQTFTLFEISNDTVDYSLSNIVEDEFLTEKITVSTTAIGPEFLINILSITKVDSAENFPFSIKPKAVIVQTHSTSASFTGQPTCVPCPFKKKTRHCALSNIRIS